jgi:20S proteasome alpha/beta subunit
MTLLVGILAKDGVVVAADSAVTMASSTDFTIVDRRKKIYLVADGTMVIAGTGQVGLTQRVVDTVDRCWRAKAFQKWKQDKLTSVQIATAVCREVLLGFEQTAAKPDVGALYAFHNAGAFHLVEYLVKTFQPEQKTADLWYASMGSGQALADAYLSLLRRTAWRDGQPSLENAILSAWWVMHHAIEAAPGFVAKPISIVVLRSWENGKAPEARFLSEDELLEHKERADQADEALRSALQEARPEDVPQAPEAPPAE